MSTTTKKKRPLVIKATGAGDPTYFLTFNVPSYSDENPTENSIAITITATLGQNATVALNYQADQLPEFPVDKDVIVGSNFTTNRISSDMNISLEITFENDEFDFDIETTLPGGVINGNSISFQSLAIKSPGNRSLSNVSRAIFQTLLDNDNGSSVFLQENGMSVFTSSLFSNLFLKNNWIVREINSNTNLYTIQNAASGNYLGITNENTLGLSSTTGNSTSWIIEKNDDLKSIYTISIVQNNSSYYLYSSSHDSVVNLNTRSCNWYLYIQE